MLSFSLAELFAFRQSFAIIRRPLCFDSNQGDHIGLFSTIWAVQNNYKSNPKTMDNF
jgi:hypothetical protein